MNSGDRSGTVIDVCESVQYIKSPIQIQCMVTPIRDNIYNHFGGACCLRFQGILEIGVALYDKESVTISTLHDVIFRKTIVVILNLCFLREERKKIHTHLQGNVLNNKLSNQYLLADDIFCNIVQIRPVCLPYHDSSIDYTGLFAIQVCSSPYKCNQIFPFIRPCFSTKFLRHLN